MFKIFQPAITIGGRTPTVAHNFTSSEAEVKLTLEYDEARNGIENFTSKKPPTAANISRDSLAEFWGRRWGSSTSNQYRQVLCRREGKGQLEVHI